MWKFFIARDREFTFGTSNIGYFCKEKEEVIGKLGEFLNSPSCIVCEGVLEFDNCIMHYNEKNIYNEIEVETI